MMIDAKHFTTASDGTLVAEHSDLHVGKQAPPHEIVLIDCPTKGSYRKFGYSGADRNGDDLAGWRYNEVNNGPLKVLIIND